MRRGLETQVDRRTGVPIPGCESMVLDPQAFLAENTCKFFNCDTLFFLDQLAAGDAEVTDEVNAEEEEHQH